MRLHADELAAAQAYEQAHPDFAGLTVAQAKLILDRGRSLYKWMKAHPAVHNAINAAVLVFLFAADWFALVRLPGLMGSGVTAAVFAGALHSYLLYSLSVYSMHEGAAHGIIFLGQGRLAQAAGWLSGQLGRVADTEPEQYRVCHRTHHAKFGTHDDAEFTSFVRAARFWRTLLPFGAFWNHSDFVVHRPVEFTRSRRISTLIFAAYQLPYAAFVLHQYGWLSTLILFALVAPHFGFYLDRLRQFTEHNHLPLNHHDGSRNFGVGFWGLLVGGGPWGSPCHLSHHLVASIPWYQQIALHFYIKRLLTPAQRKQFLIEPVIGFPKLWWRLVSETSLHATDAAQVRRDVAHRIHPEPLSRVLQVSR